MRRRIWYKVLSVLERAQVDLTLRMLERVRSPLLAKVLDSIIEKLSVALRSKVSTLIQSVGFPQALKLSRIAKSWGHRTADKWNSNREFARFLAIMHLNSVSTYDLHSTCPHITSSCPVRL
jgi:hypothetical protein